MITTCCKCRRDAGGWSSGRNAPPRITARQKQVASKDTADAAAVLTSMRAGKQQELPSNGRTNTLNLQSYPKNEPFIPYPEVKSPSESAKKRRKEELEKDKQQKKAVGFYQERSDLDDTLEQVESLKMESTEVSTARQRKPRRKPKKVVVEELATARLPD